MGIKVDRVSKCFKTTAEGECDFRAVDDVSFEVPEGNLVALLGPSGSGKSTILRVIAGLEQPDTGNVYLNGKLITGRPVQERGVGFVFQHYALFKHMSVRENIAFGLKVRKEHRAEIETRVEEMLALVHLEGYGDRLPSQLSGGQRQRVALARALAPRPKVLLLDEPFGSLDAKVRRNLATQLRQLHDEVSTTSIFVTHDQAEAFEIADQIVVINHGRVEQIGDAEEIYDHPKSKFVASFIGNVNVLEAVVENNKVLIGPKKLYVPSLQATSSFGELVFLVRPENVEEAPEKTADALEAKILNIRYHGAHYEYDLEIGGLELRMIGDKTRGRPKDRKPGRSIFIRLTKYATFEAEEGHVRLRTQLQSLGYIE